jgi:hypothetical protein
MSAVEIQACLFLTQARPKSSDVAANCLVNRGQRGDLRQPSMIKLSADPATSDAVRAVEIPVF